MRAIKTLTVLSTLAALVTAGCSTTYRSPTARAFRNAELDAGNSSVALGAGARQAGQPYRYASLGAGDRLGRQIYINDVVLASARQLNKPVATPAADPNLLQAGVTVTDLDQ